VETLTKQDFSEKLATQQLHTSEVVKLYLNIAKV
jgi:hypothetical protein